MAVKDTVFETLRKATETRTAGIVLKHANNAWRAVADSVDRSGRRAARIEALGAVYESDVNQEVNRGWLFPDRIDDFPTPPLSRHAALEGLHRVLQPQTYLEIGIYRGASLVKANTRSIGVDPSPVISYDLGEHIRIARQTSDDFFATEGALDHFGGTPIDLAFVDGMHLSEFALRDFINLEQRMAPTGAILFDDMLPRNSLEAFRQRRTVWWTGDVYKVTELLLKYRPDLVVLPLNTSPTGTLLVLGLDRENTVLSDHYDEAEAYCRTPDPQRVSAVWTKRQTAVDPRTLLASGALATLRQLRDRPDPVRLKSALDELRAMTPAGVAEPPVER